MIKICNIGLINQYSKKDFLLQYNNTTILYTTYVLLILSMFSGYGCILQYYILLTCCLSQVCFQDMAALSCMQFANGFLVDLAHAFTG